MRRRRSVERRIFFPWEGRGGLRRLLRLGRFRPVVFVLLGVGLIAIVGMRERRPDVLTWSGGGSAGGPVYARLERRYWGREPPWKATCWITTVDVRHRWTRWQSTWARSIFPGTLGEIR